jgi:hypothetical protein
VAGQRQRQLLWRNAASVVGDGDALDAALLQAHGDLGGAGIERVLQQFLDHGRRTFDHLASGNLRDQLIGQGLDGARRGGSRFGSGEECGAFMAGLYLPAPQAGCDEAARSGVLAVSGFTAGQSGVATQEIRKRYK